MEQLDSADLSPIIERMGGAMALASSARKYKAFIRPRGVKSAVDLLRLAFMYGPGGYALRGLRRMMWLMCRTWRCSIASSAQPIGCSHCARRLLVGLPKSLVSA